MWHKVVTSPTALVEEVAMRTCALLILGATTVVACGEEEVAVEYPPAKCRSGSCEEEPVDPNPCEGPGTWDVFTREQPRGDDSSQWCPTDCSPPANADYSWEKKYGCGSHFRLVSPPANSFTWVLSYLWENPGGSIGHHDMACDDDGVVGSNFSGGFCNLRVKCRFVDSPREIAGVERPPYGVEYSVEADLRRTLEFTYHANLVYHTDEPPPAAGYCTFKGQVDTWTFTP